MSIEGLQFTYILHKSALKKYTENSKVTFILRIFFEKTNQQVVPLGEFQSFIATPYYIIASISLYSQNFLFPFPFKFINLCVYVYQYIFLFNKRLMAQSYFLQSFSTFRKKYSHNLFIFTNFV